MKRLLALPLCLVIVAGCGMKIQTGPEDEQRQEEVADYRAKEIRSEWADRLRAAPPKQKVDLYKTLIDSVGASYIRYGRNVAQQWRDGNAGSGSEIADTEMREIVSRSNQSENALLQAYEDVLEHALSEIRETYVFDQTTFDLLERYADQFYKVRSTVFFPAGTVERYSSELDHLQRDAERLSEDIALDLRRY